MRFIVELPDQKDVYEESNRKLIFNVLTNWFGENLQVMIDDRPSVTEEIEAEYQRAVKQAQLHANALASFFAKNEDYRKRVLFLAQDSYPRAMLYIKSHSPDYIPLRTIRYMVDAMVEREEGR